MKNFTAAIVVVVAIVFLCGLATSTSADDPDAPTVYRIGPNDTIAIDVVGHDDMHAQNRVDAAGNFQYQYVHKMIHLGGTTQSEAADLIAKALVDAKIAVDPSVTVTIVSYGGTASILGAVGTPGVIALDHPMTLIEFLARGGGPRTDAGAYLVLRHVGSSEAKKIELKQLLDVGDSSLNTFMKNGDSVYVPTAPVYYLSGTVNRAGSYPLKEGMTVRQAIAQGGGVAPTGAETRIKITRKGADNKVTETAVGLSDPVEADDTIYVPESWF